jgi:hypothetical protein
MIKGEFLNIDYSGPDLKNGIDELISMLNMLLLKCSVFQKAIIHSEGFTQYALTLIKNWKHVIKIQGYSIRKSLFYYYHHC